MIYFDTNILVYATINQGDNKLEYSQNLISRAIEDGKFFISPIVLSEYIIVLSKLKILNHHDKNIKFYSEFIQKNLDSKIVIKAYQKCLEVKNCKSINDFIHLEIAEKFCSKLITYDNGFEIFQKFYKIDVEILK